MHVSANVGKMIAVSNALFATYPISPVFRLSNIQFLGIQGPNTSSRKGENKEIKINRLELGNAELDCFYFIWGILIEIHCWQS